MPCPLCLYSAISYPFLRDRCPPKRNRQTGNARREGTLTGRGGQGGGGGGVDGEVLEVGCRAISVAVPVKYNTVEPLYKGHHGNQLAVLYKMEPLYKGHHANQLAVLYKVEPLYKGHPLGTSWLSCIKWNHWEPAGCPV